MIDAASLVSVLQFWFALVVCGLLCWPFASLLLPNDRDWGYLAAKPLGWLIGSYAAWLACVAGIPFFRFGWMVGLGALLALFLATVGRSKAHPSLQRLFAWEAAFLSLLAVGVLIKGSSPDILGLEKFMDFGFVNAALRATSMPPPDPWWSGEPINYYYFGHMASAWLIQFSGVPSDHGFNLMVALVFAFAASLSYRTVEGCLGGRSPRIAFACGSVAAALVTFGGNFHSVLYGPFRAFSPTTYERGYFYPDSTRFVGFDPSTDDKAFTEMPAYGFAVGDLHAHLVNFPVALLLVLVFARMLQTAPDVGVRVRSSEVLTLSFLFAVSAMSNSWDAVTYGLLMALVGLMLLALTSSARIKIFLRLIGWSIFIVLLAGLLAAPFLVAFKPIASELRWSDAHTPLWQLAVLYAHVLLPCSILLVGLLTRLRHDRRWVVGGVLSGLAFCLITLPEIAYVKDIYGDDHRRANTMFKLTFEAQPVAMIASAICLGLLLQARRSTAAVAAILMAAPLLATLSYGQNIYTGRVTPLGAQTFTLTGLRFLSRGDRSIVEWLSEQPADRPLLIVELPGDSFTDRGRISAMSGVPTLLGWRGHEWLWRGDAGPVWERYDQIIAFYRSRSVEQACDFVAASKVTHVVIGTLELEQIPDLDLTVFTEIGFVVVQSGNTRLVEFDVARCKAKRSFRRARLAVSIGTPGRDD